MGGFVQSGVPASIATIYFFFSLSAFRINFAKPSQISQSNEGKKKTETPLFTPPKSTILYHYIGVIRDTFHNFFPPIFQNSKGQCTLKYFQNISMSEDVPVEEMGLEEMRDALVASRSEVASGKEKMAKWKTKMKGIIEEERKELVQLRDAQSGYEEKVSTLEVEMAKLKQERDLKHGHLDGTVGDTDPHSSHTISRLEAEKKALQDDFERFKERTNIAMKLRGKELASKQTKHSTLEDDLRSLQVELVVWFYTTPF